jgi:signal transduction histidine kinase
MRRFRILFVVVTIVLLVPLAMLVQRAVHSVELERRTRQQTVAERVFDEMERALSELLAREEDRPFGEYSYTYTPVGEPGNVRVRSPLAETPSLPFITGYFQIDPQGNLHSPLRPEPAGDWRPSAQAGRALAELERTVGPFFRSGAGVAKSRRDPAPQAPGSTVAVRGRAKPEVARGNATDTTASAGAVSAYDALRSLNKGIEQRAARQKKTEIEAAPAARESGDDRLAVGLLGDRMLERDQPPARADQAAPANEGARVEILPMVGRVPDARHIVLFRTVVRDAQTYRQGLLLDIDALTAWLRERALGTDELAAYATTAFATPLALLPAADSDAGDIYEHRFADPFADLSARLALRPLPGVGSARDVYVLCVAALAAAAIGLVALYRMVAVAVRYAERRSNFVAAVSHELKTPLTAIRMYGEMLRDDIVPSDAKRAEYHRHIAVESERLSRLINNVLEFSRLEKGTRQTSLATGSIGPVVAEAAELLRPHVEQEGFALDVDVDGSLPPVRFERDALLQTLFNLLDNAAKYARENLPKRIALCCRCDGGAVCLTVRDHGPGVRAQHLGSLFQPFYRGESELTRRSKGTGLGLALVRGLCEQMGARVAAHNVAAGGFEVEIAFPIVAQ